MGGGGVFDSDEPGFIDGETIPPPCPPPKVDEGRGNAEAIRYSPAISDVAPPRLSCPVVIPQRRSGSKGRGFMRAYAPVLADYDFSGESFLAFLEFFHKASMVMKWPLQACCLTNISL